MKNREQITVEQLWYVFQEHETAANIAAKLLDQETSEIDHTGHIELIKKLTPKEQKLIDRMMYDSQQMGAMFATMKIASDLHNTLSLMEARIGKDLYEMYKDQILEDEASKLEEMQYEEKSRCQVVPSTGKSKPVERVLGRVKVDLP